MRKLISALALIVVAACASQTTTSTTTATPRASVSGGTGAADPRGAVSGFLGAVKSQNLQALSTYWGTKDGAVRDQGSMTRDELEKRELLMMCYLRHDSYRVATDAPGTNGERVLAVELTHGTLTATTNFYAVVSSKGRWYVRQVDLEPVAEFCRRKG